MKKKIISLLLGTVLSVSLVTPIYALNTPDVYKDEVSIGVGETINLDMTFGTSATKADIFVSNINVDAKILNNNTLQITGLKDGLSYITLIFDDGTQDVVKIEVGKMSNTEDNYDLRINKNKYAYLKIDLDKYDSRRAEIKYNSNYLDLNKDVFTSDGELRIKGLKNGKTTLRIEYSSGDIEYYDIEILNNVTFEERLTIDVGDIEKYYIDLEEHHSDSCTIYNRDKDKLNVSTTRVTYSKNIEIEALSSGSGEVELHYDNGDIVYLKVNSNNTSEYVLKSEIDVDDSDSYYIDLKYHNSKSAKVYYNSKYISVNKTNFENSGYLVFYGEYKGTGEIKIVYSNGDVEYIKVNVAKANKENPYVSENNITMLEGETKYISVYLGDTTKATISSDTYNISVDNSVIYDDSRIEIKGKKVTDGVITIRFSDGTVEKVYVNVNPVNKTSRVEINDLELIEGEKSNINLLFGKSSSCVVTLSNPSVVKLYVEDYSLNRSSYTIKSQYDSSEVLKIEGLKKDKTTDISFRFSDGTTYKYKLSITSRENRITDGKDSNGNNFYLKDGVNVNKDILNRGYIKGYPDNTFGATRTITREEFGVMLSRILDTNKEITSNDYVWDVTSDWSKTSIAKLSVMGIINKNLSYRPYDNITRYEVVEMLYNVVDLSDFSDKSKLKDLTNSELDRKVAQCANSGLIAGYPNGEFGGNKTITRAEAVVILDRLFYSDLNTNKINKFKDIMPNYWAYSFILKAANFE